MPLFRNELTPQIFTIPDFLTDVECSALIQKGEELGFQRATVSFNSGPVNLPGVRNNDRAIWDDAEFSEEIWERVASLIPEGPEGQPALGLNERWRFYRYEPGQEFKRHRDGSIALPPRLVDGKRLPMGRTLMTFLIYLSDDCVGGETAFYHEDTTEIVRVAPTTGTALCFLHDIKHAGCIVREGKKYVLRSDIVFKI